MQTEDYAAAVRALGAPPERVHVTGSVKYDGVIADRNNPRTEGLRRLLDVKNTDLIWVAGSTLAPEEELVLGIFRRLRETHPNLRLFLAPRQKDRFDDVARLLDKAGLPYVRRTALNEKPTPHSCVLVDTIGELGALWGLADMAFVGGSLDGRRGGQNMIEPAAFGAAVTFGPHVWNFKEPARRLIECGGAVQVGDAAGLEQTVRRLLADGDERRRMAQAARTFVRSQEGATERTVELLDRLLGSAATTTAAA
jgi:3-deoxy-D-manno-octulosonic-acid transferase